jgi:hypothetical protein
LFLTNEIFGVNQESIPMLQEGFARGKVLGWFTTAELQHDSRTPNVLHVPNLFDTTTCPDRQELGVQGSHLGQMVKQQVHLYTLIATCWLSEQNEVDMLS